MQTYLVGGAVRDKLLGRAVKERDWVVVGATPDELLADGFKQVGKDFPVFLHPETSEEYALARTERKSGQGYTGFDCYAAPDVTLEQDLIRRDLTVNAMAEDETGQLIDPFNGKSDLDNRVLRHVSEAFVEDPLRVLRVARFAARYHGYGFTIAGETQALMTEIAANNELEALSAERVWKETERALTEPYPQVYFQVLRDCGALRSWFAELDALWGVPQPEKWHPEIDTGVHTLMVLEQAAGLSDLARVRFAALVHDLGKGITPADKLPSHHGHEQAGLKLINALCKRLRVPNEFHQLALLVGEFHTHIHRALELKPTTVLKVFNRCDVWRKPERFNELLLACKADARGRTGFENSDYPQADYMAKALKAARAVDPQQIIAQGYEGKAIGEQLAIQRQQAVADIKRHWLQNL